MNRSFTCLLMLGIIGTAQVRAQDWKSKYQTLQERIQQKKISRKDIQRDSEQLPESWGTYKLEAEKQAPLRVPKPIDPFRYVPDSTGRVDPQRELQGTPIEVIRIDTTALGFEPKGVEMNGDAPYVDDSYPHISFLGRNIPFEQHPDMQISFTGRLNPSKISTNWSQLLRSSADQQILLLIKVAYHMGLNDWGYCQLLNAFSKKLYPGDYNAQTLFNLYGLSQSGYVARIGQNNQRLYLMLPTSQRIYGHTFLKRDKTKYYLMDLNGSVPQLKQAFVLDLSFPHAEDIVSFSVEHSLRLGKTIKKRKLSFNYDGKTYQIETALNQEWVKFYNSYPFTDWHIQLGAPMSPDVHRTLISQLSELVKGRSEADAANMLLRFVQQAFPYKTDSEQFGKENYLFAEEMLFYPYSDCEDRSALYAYLVNEILGLDVIGLLFPGHAAVGVRFRNHPSGSYVAYRGKRYTVCDPTYVNANIGHYAPQVRGEEVKIIAFSP